MLNILVPLEKCLTYSISFELTYLDTSTFDYFSLVDVKFVPFDYFFLIFFFLNQIIPSKKKKKKLKK